MTQEAEKEVVLKAVQAAIQVRRDGHRYPECVTIEEVGAIIPDVSRSSIIRNVKILADEDELLVRPAINYVTVYLR